MAQHGHDKLSTFGIGADLAEAQWRGVLRQLIARNMVRVDAEAFSTLQLMPDARQVLKGEVSVVLREQAAGAKAGGRGKRVTKTSVKGLAEAALNAGALERLARLKAWRAEVAREHNLPAFVIFPRRHAARHRRTGAAKPGRPGRHQRHRRQEARSLRRRSAARLRGNGLGLRKPAAGSRAVPYALAA